ncbi:MAG: 16S rRNA (cytosine(1402)-N(4))-methyltransferase [Flavobacteriaceae bacterium]|nr:16S rRNA (cytosine(1402)-N(4))-methyltransferase [Flavobacteriaceae bacterium]
MKNYHNPVLLNESIKGLNINPLGIYVDVTFGGGGHSRAILNKLSSKGKLIAFDQDASASINLIDDSRFKLISTNFSNLKKQLDLHEIDQISGLIADFGISSHQLDKKERGFSIRLDGPLDMRMNKKNKLNAKEVVNSYNETKLVSIFKNYGELNRARVYTKKIAQSRRKEKITSTKDLQNLLKPLIPKQKFNKEMAKIFQAIRIEVNKELDAIKTLLLQTSNFISKGGRLVCISYHSLEDRLVKNFIRDGNFDGNPKVDFYGNKFFPFKKIGDLITPSKRELINNKRSRSAKLRIAEKI